MQLNESNYILVPAIARTKLDLKGNELLIFSLIHGFSQDKKSKFTGSISYICDWVGCGETTAIDTLKKLVSKQLIIKEEGNSRQGNSYRTNLEYYLDLISKNENCSLNKLVNDKNIESENTPKPEQISFRPEQISFLTGTDFVPNNITKPNQYTKNNNAENTTSSAKLFSSEKTTHEKPNKQQNRFLVDKRAVIQEFNFNSAVLDSLMDYLDMLVDIKCFIPDISFRMQLQSLSKVPDNKQLDVVRTTITNCWKSLSYAIDNLNKMKTNKFDTAAKSKCQFKDPKNDRRAELYEGRPTF